MRYDRNGNDERPESWRALVAVFAFLVLFVAACIVYLFAVTAP